MAGDTNPHRLGSYGGDIRPVPGGRATATSDETVTSEPRGAIR